MQSRLRSTVAAAMLLAPLASAFLAEPAVAQQRAPQRSISNMSVNSDGGLSPGATLRVQVLASPDARQAQLVLGDSGVTIPLRQQKAGSYTGSYVVRRSDRIDPLQAMTARVTYGDRTYTRQFNYPPAFQALAMGSGRDTSREARRDRDERPPQISELSPANGDRVSDRRDTRISARIADEGSGVDSVQLRIDGRDVTADARVSDDRVAYRGDLEPGRHRVEVKVRDRAGNASSKAWTFDVEDADRGGDRYGDSGPLPLEVSNLSDNMVVDANGRLTIQGRTVPHATVRVQVDSVATAAGMFGVATPVADHTVQADRNGYFGVAVAPRGAQGPGSRYELRVTSTSGSQTAQERLTLIPRQG